MTTGENVTTWGNVTNVNLGTAVEEMVTGSSDVTFASTTVTLTLTDTNASQTARHLRLNLVGTSGGAQNLIVPAVEKVYLVNNGCADAITVKNSSGTGTAVPAGKTMWVYNDGTNVTNAITHLTSLTLAAALPVTSGGTGVTTSTGSGNLVLSTSPTLVTPILGTPTSGNLANCTGVSLTTSVSGTLPIANGGTGSTTSSGARTNLGVPAADGTGASGSSWNISILGSSASCTGNAATATNPAGGGTFITSSNIASQTVATATTATNLSGGTVAATTITATGNITAYYSDDRLKTRLGYISGALAKVMSLKGFYYEANEVAQQLGYEPVREVGLSAQDVQAILPEVIAPAPIDPQYLTLDYARLVPLLVEAIKEQQILIDALSAKVNA
jgi:hypothetical protein